MEIWHGLNGKHSRSGCELAGWVRLGTRVASELKYNPNHDPRNGRFTGGGGSFGGGGASGSWSGDGGSGGGRGALGSGRTNKPQTAPAANSTGRPTSAQTPTAAAATPDAAKPTVEPAFRHVVRNGYDYAIDDQGRTRTVSGELMLNPDQGRSRSAQAAAGGSDRLPTDDGGHYIAARFDGPTDAFNHFAQHSNLNRGRYRALEDQWARAKRAGKDVDVEIVPKFDGSSERPATLDIWFTIDGDRKSVWFSNSSRRTRRGK